MYEMLTGRVPFDADTPVSIALKHMQEKPVEPIKLNPSIPYSVNKIIMKAMEKDLNLRYQSATEMLKDLNMALKDPEGDFVKTSSNDMAYTQRIDTIPEEAVKKEERDDNGEKEKKKGKIRTFFAKHPALKVIIIILLIILIPIIGFFGTQAILSAGRTKDIALPNFVEMTREEAETAAEEANLVLEITEEFSSEVEEGKIVSQDPPYTDGYLVKEGSTIKLVLSKGENIKIVPRATGMTREEAEQAITAEELEVEVVEEASDKVEAGYVIRQDPAAEEELNAGEKVTIYVSTGIKQITMEHVVGKSEDEAKKTLTDLGFDVTVVYEEDTSKDDGVVLRQSLDVGTTVDDGTKVTLTVNRIEEIKNGTVNINLKSLIGEEIQIADDGITEIDPTVQVRVTVTSEGTEETVYNQEQRKDVTNLRVTVSGRGTITVKVFIDEVREAQESLNLNSENPVLNID